MAEQDIKKYEPVFGEWTISRKLGQGAVGQVYEIVKEQNGETIHSALKFICIPKDEDDIMRVLSLGTEEKDLPQYYSRAMEDFVQEFRCMRDMKDCDSIVHYEEHRIVQHDDGIGWDILMRIELLTPLMEYALDHEMTEDDVIDLGIDLAKALKICEKRGIVHRDIKPDNIFVDENGTFKLGDFGVARIIEETQMNLSHKGTIAYMAPEVYRGEKYGKTADIYSVGLVLYKYLNNGRLPFMPKYPEKVDYEDDSKALVKRVRREAVPEPANGSEALKAVVMRACSGEAENRYQNASELRKALEKVRDNGEALIVKRSRHHKLTALIATLLMAACAAGGAWALIPKEVTDISGVDDEIYVHIGDSVSPQYTVEPSWFKDEKITFESEEPSVATIDKSGKIDAVAVGEANLDLKVKEYKETVHVNVIPKVTSIDNVKDIELTEGDKSKLKPELGPEEYSDEPIVYASDNTKVASVKSNGTVTAKGEGSAVITITSGGCEKKIKVKVDPKPVVIQPVTQTPSYSYNSGSSSKKKSSGSKAKSKSSKKSSGKKKSKKKSSAGYFDSGKDEYF